MRPNPNRPLRLVALLVFSVFYADARARGGIVITPLHSFGGGANGYEPVAGLVRGGNGNLYGTTHYGGANGAGTMFKIGADGGLATQYSFTGGSDGANPIGALVDGADGNLYGTTEYGGTNGWGTVFKITPAGVATPMYSFTGGSDGGIPFGVVRGGDGNFYGMTYGTSFMQGSNKYGAVYVITPAGGLTVLHSFTNGVDGANPEAALLDGGDGFLYGTTFNGGTNGYGGIFKITSAGALTPLYSFTGGIDGKNPPAGLTAGGDGNFYGTVEAGGTIGAGAVFKITPSGALTSLYSFAGAAGGRPEAGLLLGSDGNFYGTVNAGGKGFGAVFKMTPAGLVTPLYSFTNGVDGAYSEAGLAEGSDGDYYGTTFGTFKGGTNNYGTVFKITSTGVLTPVCVFTAGTDGAYPTAGLVPAGDGTLYGTTEQGGAYSSGTVFRITADGVETNLYSFTGLNDGGYPEAAMAAGSDGNFYGTTSLGGTHNKGTVFKITPAGAFASLYSFTNGNDGAEPWGGLREGVDGNFYGTAESGGTNNYGTVFKIAFDGTFTPLYSFTGGNDGGNPRTGLTEGADENLYGTTYSGGANRRGSIFGISPDGVVTLLYSFTNGIDGGYPLADLALGRDGNFYGTTQEGGANGRGTVFKITPAGGLTPLYSFTGQGGVASYDGGLVEGNDGIFYGAMKSGVSSPNGAVFGISSSGQLTGVRQFSGHGDGISPNGGLVRGEDGNLYGTANNGGFGYIGTVFRVSITPAPAPVLTNITISGSNLNLAWSATAGSVYQVQFKPDLDSTNWINLGANTTAVGPTASATDSVATAGRFYRVVLFNP